MWHILLCLGLACSLFIWSGQMVPAAESTGPAGTGDIQESALEEGMSFGEAAVPEGESGNGGTSAAEESGNGETPAAEEESGNGEIPAAEEGNGNGETPIPEEDNGIGEAPVSEEETGLEEDPSPEEGSGLSETAGKEDEETGEDDEEAEETEEEDLIEDKPEGEEVAEAIREIIEASSQMVYADRDGIERLQDYIGETRDAFDELTPEEQEILSGSLENLGHAAAAVEVMRESMDQMEATGTINLGPNGKENSWRYIDGVPVRDALAVVEEETAEVAEASPDENLLTSARTEGAERPKGELLSLTAPAGEQGRVILVGEDEVKKGIDVSKWQGVIDWEAAKEGGVRFAIIRCGYGSDFYSQDDEMWYRNVSACEELGIPYGVYLYSHATTDGMIDSEVAHTLRLLEGHNPQLPVYLDIEENSQFLLGEAKLSKLADRYCSQILAAGYRTGLYSSTYYWNSHFSLYAKNDNYYHWVAQWNPKGCSYGGRYEMWQYGIESGVPGIDGDVDMDLWYGAFPAAGSTKPAPRPVDMTKPHIEYKSHVQSFGWEGSWIRDGNMSGTEGKAKRLEGIQIQVTNDSSLGVEYQTHVQTYGWEKSWKKNGEVSGTVGEGKRLEAIRIRLTGADAGKYDIYYCVHAQRLGWLNWAKNGEEAGTAGYGYRLEAIRIQLVKKDGTAPSRLGSTYTAFQQPMIRYDTHVQTYGWQSWQYDGAMAGTTGMAKRLEGIHIQLTGQPYSGNVEYRTHIQTYGWEPGWKKNGEMSGTSGEAKRLEAIQIRLTGTIAKKYDIYYQTHVQRFGWSGWAKNGEKCGSAGYGYRLEGIRIVLVAKGGSAPGSTDGTFFQINT